MAIFFTFFTLAICIGIWEQVRKSREAKLALKQLTNLITYAPNFVTDSIYKHEHGLCCIALDSTNKRVLLANKLDRPALKKALSEHKSNLIITHKVVDFKDIVQSEIIVDGQTVSTKSSTGAIAGGLLFGTVGAVIGSNVGQTKFSKKINTIKLKVLTNDIHDPCCELTFYKKGIDKYDVEYAKKQCQQWQDTLTVAISN